MDELQPAVSSAPATGPDPRLDKVLEKLSVLEQLFVKRIKDDQAHAASYSSLHQDMSRYRDDAFRGAQKPLLKGLLLLYDTMKRSLAGIGAGTGRDEIALHIEELLELLHRHEVERIDATPERFDRTIQTALQTEAAAAPEEDQTVVRVVRDGFRWGAQILRPQEVVIRVLKG